MDNDTLNAIARLCNDLDEIPRLAERMAAAQELLVTADRMIHAYVDEAREGGWTWEQIGDALGVTRQAAHHRFA